MNDWSRVFAGGVLDVVRLVEDGNHVFGVPVQPAEELLAYHRVQQVVVVTDHQIDALHPVFQQFVATELLLLGELVDVVGRAHVVVEPRVELVVVAHEVVVVVLAGVLLFQTLDALLDLL